MLCCEPTTHSTFAASALSTRLVIQVDVHVREATLWWEWVLGREQSHRALRPSTWKNPQVPVAAQEAQVDNRGLDASRSIGKGMHGGIRRKQVHGKGMRGAVR